MLDIKRIKEDPNGVKAALHAKEVDCDATIDRILELDEARRELIASTETRKARQNKVSKDIPMLKKAGQDVSAVFAEMAELKAGIAADAAKLDEVLA
jgi:seryl-tRNA synthetase